MRLCSMFWWLHISIKTLQTIVWCNKARFLLIVRAIEQPSIIECCDITAPVLNKHQNLTTLRNPIALQWCWPLVSMHSIDMVFGLGPSGQADLKPKQILGEVLGLCEVPDLRVLPAEQPEQQIDGPVPPVFLPCAVKRWQNYIKWLQRDENHGVCKLCRDRSSRMLQTRTWIYHTVSDIHNLHLADVMSCLSNVKMVNSDLL